jgi:anti-sigma B factor antagonist
MKARLHPGDFSIIVCSVMPDATLSPSPEFSVEMDMQSDAIVAHCAGRLTISTGDILRNEVRKCIKPGARIVVDLTHVTYCDSTGLGTVISLYVSSRATGCKFEIINLGEKIRKLFSMANILSLFEAAADRSSRIP